jgi:hypothetical protein
MGLARAVVLDLSPTELTIILYCLILDSPNMEGQVPVFISPGTGWPSYTPGHWVLSCQLLGLAGLRWRYSNPPLHEELTFDVLVAQLYHQVLRYNATAC